MTPLTERALVLVKLAGSAAALARVAGVSAPSVSDWISGKTLSIKARNAALIAQKWGLNPLWVSDGIGEKFAINKRSGGNPPGGHVHYHAPVTDGDATTAGIEIPQYETGGAMGNGGLVLSDQPGVIHNWNVSREWVEKNVRGYTSIANLCIVTGFGPSMIGMFNPGDPLIVDRGYKTCDVDAPYFFRIGEHGFIKILQRIPRGKSVIIRAKSKNPDYDPFDIDETMDFEIFGRVLRAWVGSDY